MGASPDNLLFARASPDPIVTNPPYGFKFMSYSAREMTRIREGFCFRCGEPRGFGGTAIYCAGCKRKKQADAKRSLHKARAKGLCVLCRSERGDTGTAYYCRACCDRRIEYMRRRRIARKKAGVCPDHGVPVGKYKYCVKCRNRPDKRRPEHRAEMINR